MDLLARTREAARRALDDGALHPLTAVAHPIEQDGVPYVVREVQGIHKPHGTREADPFRPPYTDALYVGEWPPAHALLLNKFPVLPDHLLLVTTAWADQEDPLDRADWDALARALDQVDGLGFYNGGRESGASQPHRHLQLVPGLLDLPLGPAIAGGLARGVVEGWPFRHVVSRPTFEGYQAALDELGRGPHNALRTRDWLLVVPRRQAYVEGIPVNALSYVGMLAVRTPEQLARVRERGPRWVLAEAGRS
jgi:ATP adenylyltransferase